ncbi:MULTISPECIES: antibiotic biosynthesis monooxygenase [unclassified Mumia]|uniref:antibiotic biosynthesis monooxygenase family protein n=1 Tax=unclassified Mumia TaxID=2621872 RepID=UPI002107A7AB|nr:MULTISPECIES: antibiotic biosynthesis monooxygenase [unclassified Mumia]
MSVIKINAITVPADSGDELAHRFAARAGAVDDVDGFEGFELLKPTDERTTWLVITRWRDDEAFEAWKSSPAFAHGHGDSAVGAHGHGGEHAGHSAGEHAGHGGGHGGHAGAHGHGGEHAGHGQRPVGVSAELWSYEVAGGTSAS